MPRKVLLVEDDEDLAFLVAMLLRDEGYEVAMAGHGRAALELVAAAQPDLILLDLKMPVMCGAEFAREYRVRYGRSVPIVVLTAAEDAQRRAAEIDAEGWLGKPFDPEALLSTVRRYAPRLGHMR